MPSARGAARSSATNKVGTQLSSTVDGIQGAAAKPAQLMTVPAMDPALAAFADPGRSPDALQEILKLANPVEMAERLSLQAGRSGRGGDLRTQRRLLELGLGVFRAVLGPSPRTAMALTELGTCHYRGGRYGPAMGMLEEALAMMAEARGDRHPDILPVLIRLARLFIRLGRLKQAWMHAERAVKVAQAAHGPQGVELAEPLGTLAEVYFGLGILDKCHAAAERALSILRAALGEDDLETAKAGVRFGVLLTEMGVYDRARELHGHALSVMRAHGRSDWVAAILASVAEIDLALGEFDAAHSLCQEALDTARAAFGAQHPTTGAYLAVMGDCCVRMGADARADKFYRRALSVMRGALGEMHPDVARLLLKLGGLRETRESEAGRDAIFRAIAMLASVQYRPRLFVDGYLFLAQMLRSSSAGILFRKLAINDIDSMRAHVARLDGKLEQTFLRHNADEFRELADLLICRGRLPEAQQVLSMIKEGEHLALTGVDLRRTKVSLTPLEMQWARRGARVVARLRSSLNAADAHGEDSHSRRTRRRIRRAGSEVRAWLAALDAAFAAVEAASAASAAEAAAGHAPGPTPWQPPDAATALLQYLFAPDRRSISIILTTVDQQREFRVPFADGEVNRLVFAMRDAVQHRSSGFLEEAQRLHRLLIAPVAPELRSGIDTLLLWLDDVLRYLPVAALHDGDRYLLERFALLSAAGTSATSGRARPVPRASGLGASRPIAGYPPLPAVREELCAVIRTEGAASGVLPGVISLDGEFTAQALRHALSNNPVVHVASHFVFEAAQEASSYLLLGDGSKLTLADLAELQFGALDLIVLSACNTAIGGGHRQSGREIEGLGALARDHGARKVLATLWPVADLATAALMRDFYHLTYEIGLRPAQALRRAQLALLAGRSASRPGTPTRSLIDDGACEGNADTSHPFYWAPYVLTEQTMRAAADRR